MLCLIVTNWNSYNNFCLIRINFKICFRIQHMGHVRSGYVETCCWSSSSVVVGLSVCCCGSVYLSVCLSVVCLSVYLSVCLLWVCLSVCLSVVGLSVVVWNCRSAWVGGCIGGRCQLDLYWDLWSPIKKKVHVFLNNI